MNDEIGQLVQPDGAAAERLQHGMRAGAFLFRHAAGILHTVDGGKRDFVLLRVFARHLQATGRSLRRFSLDVQSSTGYNATTGVGMPALDPAAITYSQPSRSGQAFGLRNLRDWIDGIPWPYAGPP